jgi:hypothetical protein
MFLLLTAGWGLIIIGASKGMGDTEILLLKIIVSLFGLQAIWFFILAVRLGRNRHKG